MIGVVVDPIRAKTLHKSKWPKIQSRSRNIQIISVHDTMGKADQLPIRNHFSGFESHPRQMPKQDVLLQVLQDNAIQYTFG